MEINGFDTIIKHNLSPEECVEVIRGIIVKHWLEVEVEVENKKEIFWYCDKEAREKWDEDDGHENSMIYTIITEEECTLVHDSKFDPIVAEIVKKLSK